MGEVDGRLAVRHRLRILSTSRLASSRATRSLIDEALVRFDRTSPDHVAQTPTMMLPIQLPSSLSRAHGLDGHVDVVQPVGDLRPHSRFRPRSGCRTGHVRSADGRRCPVVHDRVGDLHDERVVVGACLGRLLPLASRLMREPGDQTVIAHLFSAKRISRPAGDKISGSTIATSA